MEPHASSLRPVRRRPKLPVAMLAPRRGQVEGTYDSTPDKEADDKWPPDLNDDQAINILDRAIQVLYVLQFQVTGTCPST